MNKVINTIKKFPIIAGIIITVLLDKITDIPLQDFLSKFMSYQTAYLLHISIVQVFCGLLAILILKKLKLDRSYGLFSKIPIKKQSYSFFLLIAFMSIIILVNIFSNSYDILYQTSLINIILYILGFMSTGFFEELVSRALVFNIINNKYGQTRKGFFLSIFVANIIFGSTHFVWYLLGLYPLSTSLNQILYAFLIGVFFSGVYLKYNSLIIPMIFHGLVDVTGDLNYLLITSKELCDASLVQNPATISDFIASLVIFIPFFIVGLILLRNVGPKNNKDMHVEVVQ